MSLLRLIIRRKERFHSQMVWVWVIIRVCPRIWQIFEYHQGIQWREIRLKMERELLEVIMELVQLYPQYLRLLQVLFKAMEWVPLEPEEGGLGGMVEDHWRED